MSYILPLLLSIFATGMLSVLFKKRFEIMLPITYMLMAITVYIFEIFNLFEIGFYIIILFALAFPIYLIYCKFKNKSIKNIFKNVFTPGFIIFLIVYTFIYILNFNRGYNVWDEFSHWGVMVKETFSLKDFYNSPKSILQVHADYPPIITIFETIWCMISNGYKESFVYTSIQMLGLSMLFPFLSKLKFDKSINFVVKILLLTICIITMPILITVGEAQFYSTIYTDVILGISLAYGLSLVYTSEKYDKFLIFNLSLLFSFIILTKQIAIVFIMLIIGNLLLNLIIKYHKNIVNAIKNNYKKIIIYTCILIVIPIVLMYIWNSITKSNGIEGQFVLSKIKLGKLIPIYRGIWGEAYQNQAIHNFIDAILSNYKFVNTSFISFGYIQLILLSCLLVYFVGKFSKNKLDVNRNKSLIVTIIVGAIGYAFTLLVLYVFTFDSYEAPRLASIYRYVNTYWCAIFITICLIYVYCNSDKKTNILYILVPLSIIYIFWFDSNVFKTFKPVLTYSSNSQVVKEDVDNIKKYIKDNDEKVFVIAQNTDGLITFLMQYLLVPNKMNTQFYSIGEKYGNGDVWTKDITSEEWIKELRNYDYLYLYNIDDNFKEKYGKCFASFDDIKNKSMYKIDNDKLNLIK